MRTRKLLLGLVAAATIATPLALATTAEAVTTTSTDPLCVPVFEKGAVAEVNHIEYKYKPAVGTGHIKWSTANVPTEDFGGVAYVRDGNKTQLVIDSPAVAAVDGVTCQVALPANPLPRTGVSANTVIPTPEGTDKYSFTAVTNHINLNGKIGTTVTAKPGYVFPGGVAFKVYAVVVDNSGHLFYSQEGTPQEGRHINLPDVFEVEQDFEGVTYYSTRVDVTVVNDTNTGGRIGMNYDWQQDGNRVWIERGVFDENWRHDTYIPAGESRAFHFDVWYDAPSGADVPDDLVMDFGFTLG